MVLYRRETIERRIYFGVYENEKRRWLAQCSRVGGNLNQLARHFNSGGADTEQIRAKLLDELADLTAFRLHAEKVLGELYGNAQAYRL